MDGHDLVRIYIGSFVLSLFLGAAALLTHKRVREGKQPHPRTLEVVFGGIMAAGVFALLYGLVPLWGAIACALVNGMISGAISTRIFTQRFQAQARRFRDTLFQRPNER
jgi:hypothetical protein